MAFKATNFIAGYYFELNTCTNSYNVYIWRFCLLFAVEIYIFCGALIFVVILRQLKLQFKCQQMWIPNTNSNGSPHFLYHHEYMSVKLVIS